jgi:uncharacterized membrane protein YbaN (DUF454 family)
MPPDTIERPAATGLRRVLYVSLGLFFVGMAYLGAILPGLPTTPWVLLASYFFGRSSPRLQRWLLRTPYFGSLLNDWQQHRGMRRSKKIVASVLMLIAISCSIVFARLPDWVQWCIAGAGVVGFCVIWGVVKTVVDHESRE